MRCCVTPDPTLRFSNCVSDYVRFRPRYPDAVIPLLRREIGLQPNWTIADIGSGTGFSCELFLKHGNTVVGVEPNEEMRAAGDELLKSFPRFHSVSGTAEGTTLENGSVDAIVAGQAFHWFDVERARAESSRILKAAGWAILMWNTRRTAQSKFLQDYEQMLNTYGIDYHKVRHEKIDDAQFSRFFANGYQRRLLPNEQIFDFEGLKGRLLSCSYVPTAEHPNFKPMLAELKRIFDLHQRAGSVRFEYDTEIYFGRLNSWPS